MLWGAWLNLYAQSDLKNHTMPQSEAEGHSMVFKITEGL